MYVLDRALGTQIQTISVSNPTNIMSYFDIWYVNSGSGIVEFLSNGTVNAIAPPNDPSITCCASATAADAPMEYYYYSADGNLYYYSVGAMKNWESYVGEVLDYGPRLGTNNIYHTFRDGTIRSYARTTGAQKWSLQLDYLTDFCLAHNKLFVVSGGYLQCYA